MPNLEHVRARPKIMQEKSNPNQTKIPRFYYVELNSLLHYVVVYTEEGNQLYGKFLVANENSSSRFRASQNVTFNKEQCHDEHLFEIQDDEFIYKGIKKMSDKRYGTDIPEVVGLLGEHRMLFFLSNGVTLKFLNKCRFGTWTDWVLPVEIPPIKKDSPRFRIPAEFTGDGILINPEYESLECLNKLEHY